MSSVFQAVPSAGAPVNSDSMNALRDNFERRLNGNGVASPTIRIENGNRILVELAGVKDPDGHENPTRAHSTMEFRTEGPDGKTDGRPGGADRRRPKEVQGRNRHDDQPAGGRPLLQRGDGTTKFAQATAANVGKTIGIYLDNQLLTNPVVKEAIPSGNAVISGGYKTLQDAQNDAVLLNAGALPVSVK